MILLILTALVTFGGWIFWNWKINKTFGSISHDQDVAETYSSIVQDADLFTKDLDEFWKHITEIDKAVPGKTLFINPADRQTTGFLPHIKTSNLIPKGIGYLINDKYLHGIQPTQIIMDDPDRWLDGPDTVPEIIGSPYTKQYGETKRETTGREYYSELLKKRTEELRELRHRKVKEYGMYRARILADCLMNSCKVKWLLKSTGEVEPLYCLPQVTG